MEGFLKEVTEKGFIRKTSAVVPFGDLESAMEPDRDRDRAREALSLQGSAEEIRGDLHCTALRCTAILCYSMLCPALHCIALLFCGMQCLAVRSGLYTVRLLRVSTVQAHNTDVSHTHCACIEFDRGMSLGDVADRGDIDSEGSDSDDSNEVRSSLCRFYFYFSYKLVYFICVISSSVSRDPLFDGAGSGDNLHLDTDREHRLG